MRYLDIDTLLCEEERIPCIFQSEGKILAFLDASLVQEEDLPQFAKIELPLWLAAALSDRNMIRVEVPKHFSSKMRDELMADALSVNLREFSNYFFEVGLILCRITRDDDLQRTLRVSFCGERFRSLLVRSFSSGHEDSAEFAQTLTSKESQLYTLGTNTSKSIYDWKTRAAFIIQKSSLLRRRSIAGDYEQDKKRQAL